MALIAAMNGSEDMGEVIDKYLVEKLPEISEERGDFIENNKELLESVAGQEIDLSKYKKLE